MPDDDQPGKDPNSDLRDLAEKQTYKPGIDPAGARRLALEIPGTSSKPGSEPESEPTGFLPHHVQWIVMGTALFGAGVAALFSLYIAQVSAPNLWGNGWFLTGGLFSLGFAGLGIYAFLAPFANFPLPEPKPETQHIWRIVSYLIAAIALLAICALVFGKIIPAFRRNPSSVGAANSAIRHGNSGAVGPTYGPTRTRVRSLPIATATPLPSVQPTAKALSALPKRSPAKTAPPLQPLWPSMDQQEKTLLGLIAQTDQAKQGVWLSQIVRGVNTMHYDGVPSPDSLNYPEAAKALARLGKIEILDEERRDYVQSGGSVEFHDDIKFRLPSVASSIAVPPPQSAPASNSVVHLTVAQADENTSDTNYPYRKRITVQTNKTISPVSIAVLFSSVSFDKNAVVGFGLANGVAMLLAPRGYSGTHLGTPVVWVLFSGTPMTPDNPLVITVQAKSDFQAQSAMVEPYYEGIPPHSTSPPQ